jgi:hypothetical protein
MQNLSRLLILSFTALAASQCSDIAGRAEDPIQLYNPDADGKPFVTEFKSDDSYYLQVGGSGPPANLYMDDGYIYVLANSSSGYIAGPVNTNGPGIPWWLGDGGRGEGTGTKGFQFCCGELRFGNADETDLYQSFGEC